MDSLMWGLDLEFGTHISHKEKNVDNNVSL